MVGCEFTLQINHSRCHFAQGPPLIFRYFIGSPSKGSSRHRPRVLLPWPLLTLRNLRPRGSGLQFHFPELPEISYFGKIDSSSL